MNTVLRLFAVLAFGVIGGFLVYLAGDLIDRVLHPECNLCKVAGLSLFTTFLVVFGLFEFVWPPSGQDDPLP
jgi:hypothetical protein